MARDIKIDFTDLNNADFILGNGDLERESGLVTSVIISLFTDRRAEEDDNYENGDRRGWWADNISEVEGDQIGSKLYLLDRSKATQENIVKLQQYSFEALEWMLEDGVAEKIETEAYSFGPESNKRVALKVNIHKSDGNNIAIKFEDVWELTPVIGGN